MRGAAWNVLLGVAAAFVVVAGLKAAASILIPLVLAVLIAIAVHPVVSWLRQRGAPLGVAVLCSILVALVALATPVAIVGQAATQFVARVPAYHAALNGLVSRLSDWLEDLGLGLELPLADPGILIESFRFVASSTATLLANVFLVLLIVAFALLEAAEFRPKLRQAFRVSEDTVAKLSSGTHHVYQFLWLKTLVSAATGLAAGLWAAAMGIEFALLWGLSAFLLNYIPNFGSFLAAVPPVVLALISGGGWHALIVAVGYIAINILFGSVLEPRLVGRRLGLSPLALVVSLVFWGWVWGAVGLLLAVPVTIAVRLVLEEFEQTRWVAVLIARAPGPRG